MKKGIVIGCIVLAVIGGIIVQQYNHVTTHLSKSVQMAGHSVKTVFETQYHLNNEEVESMETTLNQLDQFIKESFDEIAVTNAVDGEKIKKRIAHMQRVSFLSLELMKAYEEAEGIRFTKEQAKELMLAAYLHDIRKYADGNHAKQGAKYVLEKLPEYMTIDVAQLDHISQLIKYHSDPLSEKQMTKLGDYAILAQLLQDADTADKIINRGESDEEIAKLNLSSSVNLVAFYQGK
ncbi:HD domain-containing protein [Cellulosilyticum ruminicola]|uniref:HD domain-containing protein n=1 Tax=Cellulosilyticum ruminicola TaxID=425254 RepID=UPI0006D02E80|nr:HD domain-containing protein [Cellulosilyticum ruminicola]